MPKVTVDGQEIRTDNEMAKKALERVVERRIEEHNAKFAEAAE